MSWRITLKYVVLLSVLGLVLPASPTLNYLSASLRLTQQDEKPNERAIIADDFLKGRAGNQQGRKTPTPTYRLAKIATRRSQQAKLQVGVTIWKFESSRTGAGSYWNRSDWTPKRVEADMKFREGDTLRISIESPRAGYLYVVNRDLLADGTYGETNLIFPTEADDNRLESGKLIDIPGPADPPFKASPKTDQSSELLTIIVTSKPLPLRLGPRAMPISKDQLNVWEERWGGEFERLEMNGGVGKVRTTEEKLAASGMRSRQLTREDPMPQTIYSLSPPTADGLLFNLQLFYAR
jgi:hypothetical protein